VAGFSLSEKPASDYDINFSRFKVNLGFNTVEKDTQVGSDIWQSDDVLGWMYESYNNVKKKAHKDSGDKTEYNKVSLQSQVYTPLWVVQFLVENSLGQLYLEMYPDSVSRNKEYRPGLWIRQFLALCL
jgi:hypothetical protein